MIASPSKMTRVEDGRLVMQTGRGNSNVIGGLLMV